MSISEKAQHPRVGLPVKYYLYRHNPPFILLCIHASPYWFTKSILILSTIHASLHKYKSRRSNCMHCSKALAIVSSCMHCNCSTALAVVHLQFFVMSTILEWSCLQGICTLFSGCFGALPDKHDKFDPAADADVPATNYHVFISHRGPDSKKTLVDVLHEWLVRTGFTCFVDYAALRQAETSWPSIVSAIRHSEVQIIVLSPTFAESEWCLEEVHLIMQGQTTSKVLPVFYNVNTSYLRSSADVLDSRAHASAGKWADALRNLSRISGFRSDQTGGFEGQLAKRIVSRVAELVENPALYVNPALAHRYCTQIDEAEKCLDLNSSDSRAIVSLGIAGVPHVGKSTIAKLLFNKFHKRFEASSILLDIRGRAKSSEGLEGLQMKLLKDLVNEDKKIHHTDEGLELLLQRLKNKKCFLVLDDIDMQEQLTKLLVLHKECLGGGSRLVITSRYQEVLRQASVDTTLNVTNIEEQQLVISYAGVEVHQGFIDHLEESFSMLGLSVSVQKGALLHAALRAQTKLVLVVLSKSFLSSPQLLDELGEVSNSSNATIVPIFYDLEPHTVEEFQSETGEGCSSASIHKQRWKDTLQGISVNTLHYFIDIDKPTQRAPFKSLINDVLKHLRHKDAKVDVAKYPVGLMGRQQQVERLISNISDNQVRRVGVVGMGGVGKTTLVKALYNNMHKKFEGSAILLNIRAEAQAGRLPQLQDAIIKQVVDIPVPMFSSVEEGKILLSQRLAGTNALVILDDVDHVSQLDALVTPLVLGQGSRVIITSRNHDILRSADVDKIYDVELLDESHAKMLFWWHAFLRPYPPAEVAHLAQQVIEACQGLPLSLEITGAHIYDNSDNIEVWEETLLHLKNAQDDIFAKLRLSVDALQSDQRMAFLDVACFLIGKKEKTAARLWRGCGWPGTTYLQVLKNKCLVTVDPKDGILGMHDQIRDMGRHIVSQDKPPHTRSHIWDQEDARNILQTSLNTHGDMVNIRGLCWKSQTQPELNAHSFRGLPNLKLLLLTNVTVNGDFLDFHGNIRWLEWHHCSLEKLPPGLCLRTLSVLDLSESHHLKALWAKSDDTELTQVPEKLLELNLSGCKVLQELPQFDPYLLWLQWLNLSGCCELTQLHTSIGCLTSLELLDLTGCENLQFLPDEIKGLKSLTKLILHGCKSLRSLPDGIGQLGNLRNISLNHTRLATLPASFGELKRLERLELSNCSELASLPISVKHLTMLKFCDMSDCPMLESLPDGFCDLTKLSELKLATCNLQSLPTKFGNLSNLELLWLQKNPRLTGLPSSIGKLRSLKTMDLSYCLLTNDGTPDEVAELEALEELSLQYTALHRVPESFTMFRSVSVLHMHHCDQLTEAAFFPPRLTLLELGHCTHLRIVSGLNSLKELQNLVLCDCCELQELNGLEGLDSLQSLNISGCSSLRFVTGLEAMTSLKRLHQSGSQFIPPTNLFEQLSSLEHVTVFASEMPKCFRNCMSAEIQGVEHANELIMQIPVDKSGSSFAILLCLVSHDQGWSDYSHDYGSYIESPTLVEGVLVRNCTRVAVELLYRNRHADCRHQVNVIILRPECPLLQNAKVEDTLEIRARSFYQAWRITVKQASYKVVDVDKDLEAALEKISAELRWAALHSFVLASVILDRQNKLSMRGLAAMDIAGNSELTTVRPSKTHNDLEVEKLDLVWRPNLQDHERVRIISHWWPSDLHVQKFGLVPIPNMQNRLALVPLPPERTLEGKAPADAHDKNLYRCFMPITHFGQMVYSILAVLGPAGSSSRLPLVPVFGVHPPTGHIFETLAPIDACSHLQVLTKRRTKDNETVIFQCFGLDLRTEIHCAQLYSQRHEFCKPVATEEP